MLHEQGSAEAERLAQAHARSANWQRWGPYLAERQWGTVREDYSADGNPWSHFPHEHARSRAYRWGEDGLLGITDRQCRLCFALALWNEADTILKERLFGLTGPEGNHGEDVKECYYYLDSTPTHSYMRALYKYPQGEFPYRRLIEENRARGREQPEFELLDSGIFQDDGYFDVEVEYAKHAPDDILVRIHLSNRNSRPARLHLLPTLWFRNIWSWGKIYENCQTKPRLAKYDTHVVLARHESLGNFRLALDAQATATAAQAGDPGFQGWLFTDNETNYARLGHSAPTSRFCKDAFHAYLIGRDRQAINPAGFGTKAACHLLLELAPHATQTVALRLAAEDQVPESWFGDEFARVFACRKSEADEFYDSMLAPNMPGEERLVARQAFAGLMWTKQFYYYSVSEWLDGDDGQPDPPPSRRQGRNHDWRHLFNRDVISMPDKWEYPWYAAWDLAFHMVPCAMIDAEFAKSQLLLLLREWYMHPNGQIPAYEFAFSDVNPPVHAWACWRVYKMTGQRGNRDRAFLARAFHKLLLNFTWWVNRKDPRGNHLFAGGFLGLDNIGVFDRSQPLPMGGHLEQADGTAWMAFFCGTMLSMALELATEDPEYEDIASKFFEHFIAIADAMNELGGSGLWDEEDGFYYDQLFVEGRAIPLRTRSLVGLVPLFAAEVLEDDLLRRLPGFRRRMEWFLKNRPDLARQLSCMDLDRSGKATHAHRLLAIPSRDRLQRVLQYVADPAEFLSPYGIRSLSKYHEQHPYLFHTDGREHRVDYEPGESKSGLFGGNSNWRGPVWFPMNFLLIEALERYHHFYGDDLRVEFPVRSGRLCNLQQIADGINRRLTRLFLPDETGCRPCHGMDARYAQDPHWKELVLFYEYFHGDNGRGVGASHQTGWTAVVAKLLDSLHARPA